jgi:hypothetical protein
MTINGLVDGPALEDEGSVGGARRLPCSSTEKGHGVETAVPRESVEAKRREWRLSAVRVLLGWPSKLTLEPRRG